MSLAGVSDGLLITALLSYATAMVGHAAEYAFGDKGKVAAAAKVPALVGVGGPSQDSDTPVSAAPADSRPSKAERFGRLAVAATVLGFVAQVGSLTARGFDTDRVPWGNMYEFVALVCATGVAAWLVVLAYRPVRYLGLFVLLPVVTLLGLAGTVLYSKAGPLAPALNSYWLKIHVSTAALSSGVFLVGFVTAVLYLIRNRYERSLLPSQRREADAGDVRDAEDEATPEVPGFLTRLAVRLPAAETLERLTFRIHALAFPVWTFAIIAGAIWAEAAWTRYWGWDPKETWAFISWVIYAAYLHARATAGWRGTRAMWIVIAGWTSMMVNLFAVNLIYTGLHSYAGIS